MIAERIQFGFEAVAADLDGDGRLEVVASSGRTTGEVAWFRNDGDPAGAWTRHPLTTGWDRAVQVVTGDLDRDGKLDIVAVSEVHALQLRWWRNEGPGK